MYIRSRVAEGFTKKIQDIKIRETRPLRVPEDISEHGFWHGVAEPRERRPYIDEKLKSAIAKGSIVTIILFSFFAFSLARAYDAKGKVEVLTENTKIYLDDAFSSLNDGDIDSALSQAGKAQENIKEIKLNLQSWGQDLSYFSLISNKHSATVNLEMALDAANLILGTVVDSQDGLKNTISQKFANDSDINAGKNFGFDLNTASEDFSKTVDQSYNKLEQSERIIDRINLDQLGSFKESITKAKIAVATAKKSIEGTKTLVSKDLPWISAKDGGKRDFLIIFQNNSELRGGTGGSFGSFGIAHFQDGKYTGIDFGTNIYKIDHAFEATNQIAPPEDLTWVVGDNTWALKDSGWAVDGPEAFQKVKWFYEAETGQKIDGVITIDSSAFVDILRLIGPIELPAYGKTIDANNFKLETEKEVHETYFTKEGALAENEPKKILSEMMPVAIERLFGKLSDQNGIVDLFKTFSDLFFQKHMLLFVFDQDIQNDFDKYNISGKIRNNSDDYLYINNSNLNGAKSSSNISESVVLDSTISSDGSASNILQIKRKHDGSETWPDGFNKNMVRLLTPKDTKVVNFEPVSGNFEQDATKGYKNGKIFWSGTEFENPSTMFWMNTEPKAESEVKIAYTFATNNLDSGNYSITFQRQPGANADNIVYTVHFPEGITPVNLTEYDSKSRTATFNFQLVSDKTINIKLLK